MLFSLPPGGEDRVSVQSLLSYALSVPDLEAGRSFYSTFGLTPIERRGTLAFRCDGREQDQVLLVEGRRKRLHHLRFGTDEAGLATIRKRIRQRGIAEEDEPLDDFAGGLWLRDPDGNAINIRNEPAQPWRSGNSLQINQPGHYVRFERGCPPRHPVRPTRLGHVLLFTPRLEQMVTFYRELLGLRLSDQVPGIISFLHLPCGGDHHVLALARDAMPGFHHASFEVESPDDIGLGAQAVLAAGYRNGWGFGRHVIGSNYFHYLRDPWMSLAEYFCDIDQIPGDGSWQPHDLGPEDALYRWGPEPPPDFIRNFEVA
jgi:catechol 2,3-dioxygenase-like lactoylglutathione lyase family enzyme